MFAIFQRETINSLVVHNKSNYKHLKRCTVINPFSVEGAADSSNKNRSGNGRAPI